MSHLNLRPRSEVLMPLILSVGELVELLIKPDSLIISPVNSDSSVIQTLDDLSQSGTNIASVVERNDVLKNGVKGLPHYNAVQREYLKYLADLRLRPAPRLVVGLVARMNENNPFIVSGMYSHRDNEQNEMLHTDSVVGGFEVYASAIEDAFVYKGIHPIERK